MNQDNLTIINNFINDSLTSKNNTKENLEELEKLRQFLKTINFIPTIDKCIELIKNNQNLFSILQSIIESNTKQIKQKGIEIISNNYTIIMFLDAYCIVNNISLEDLEEDQLYAECDSSSLDTFRAYITSIPKELLSREEEIDLVKKTSQGNEYARNKLVEHNLKLVISIARKYIGRGIPLLDLIQEGNIGLMTAIDKYDLEKGYRISTYATYWIRQSIQRAIEEKGKTIRIPSYLYERINKFRKAESILTEKLNRPPTKEELSTMLNISIKELEETIKYTQDAVSLNALVGDEEETELQDFIPSDEESVEELYQHKELINEIRKLLDICNLTEKERKVITLRFGLDGEIKSLAEIGEMFDVTRERVRQIEARVLRKIKNNSYTKNLISYTDNPEKAKQTIEMNEIQRVNVKLNEIKLKPKAYSKTKELVNREEIELQNTKSITEINKNNQEEEEDMNKRKITIYEYFEEEGYTKEEVKSIFPELPQSYIEIITIRHGGSLENPKYQKLEASQKTTYSKALKLVHTKLKEKYGIKQPNNENPEVIIVSPETETVHQVIETKQNKAKNKNSRATIYEYFKYLGYTKAEVEEFIEQLPPTQLNVVILRNVAKLTNYERKIYAETLNEILEKLEQKYRKREHAKESISIVREESNNLKENQVDNQTITEENPVNKKTSRSKRKLTIYEYFEEKGYSKEQVEEFLPSLTPTQLKTVKEKNGGDLDNPCYTKIYSGQQTYFNALNVILKKLDEKYGKSRIIDKQIDSTLGKTSKEQTINDNNCLDNSTIKDTQIELLAEEHTLKSTNVQPITQVKEKTQSKEVTKEEYIKILELLKTPTFNELMTQLDAKSAVIISLRLGYVDNKYFSTESIAEFLGIEESEVRAITTNALTLYKNYLNEFIDKAISYTDSHNHTKKITTNSN